jgi:hypothetical protein
MTRCSRYILVGEAFLLLRYVPFALVSKTEVTGCFSRGGMTPSEGGWGGVRWIRQATNRELYREVQAKVRCSGDSAVSKHAQCLQQAEITNFCLSKRELNNVTAHEGNAKWFDMDSWTLEDSNHTIDPRRCLDLVFLLRCANKVTKWVNLDAETPPHRSPRIPP